MTDLLQLEARYTQLKQLPGMAVGLSDADLAACIDFSQTALGAGRADWVVEILELVVKRRPADAKAWQLLGFACRAEQRMPEAAQALGRAAQLDPRDSRSALGHAQSCFEAGLPAAQLFRRALAAEPGHLPSLISCAAALAAEGQTTAADEMLAAELARRPDWLEGQRNLAALRWTVGDAQHFARSYVEACRVQPQNLPLRLAWFSAIAQTRDWSAALAILDEGEKIFGPKTALTIARLFVASESGDRVRAGELFAQTEAVRDDVRDLAHIRHCLRTGQLDKAEILAQRLLNTASASMIWPYLSLIWRLRGDARAQWLEGEPSCIRVMDLQFAAGELEELAAVLRQLHTARAPYLEQSVRGGTQTDRQLLFRAEPVIQALRANITAAVREYVAALPGPVPGHPLLGTPRAQILFSGSWSVLLRSQGFHVSHTHPMGWISSAFYVSLPRPDQLGAAPAGWISFGTPPVELGLNLPPYRQVEPKPGRLVLFPSTMWHSTLPFADGERLVVAFDVRRPGF